MKRIIIIGLHIDSVKVGRFDGDIYFFNERKYSSHSDRRKSQEKEDEGLIESLEKDTRHIIISRHCGCTCHNGLYFKYYHGARLGQAADEVWICQEMAIGGSWSQQWDLIIKESKKCSEQRDFWPQPLLKLTDRFEKIYPKD